MTTTSNHRVKVQSSSKAWKGKGVIEHGKINMYKPIGQILLEGSSCKFMPTVDMGLTTIQLKVCEYVFNDVQNSSEVVFTVGNIHGSINDFLCLCPGESIRTKVMEMAVTKGTWKQHHVSTRTVWYLPPSFEVDAMKGNTIEELQLTYASEWMHPFEDLKFIYVPIEEIGEHWYLMVVSIEEKKIYQLDSYLPTFLIEPRRDTIRTLSKALADIIATNAYPPNYLNGRTDFGNWEIIEGRGIPNYGQSDNSGVWVFDWMNMSDVFNPRNIIGVLKERLVRVRTGMDLLLGDHNECKKLLEAKAETYWKTLKN